MAKVKTPNTFIPLTKLSVFSQPTSSLSYSPAFTIIELLVVMVIIGILAAITIVSYTGITQRAAISSLQSDLTNASNQLKLYYQLYSSYPTAMTGNCPTAPTADNAYCIKASTGNTLTYTSVSPSTFHLTETNGTNSYTATDTTSPSIATTATNSTTGNACPSGFIPVPGSGTYGTNDFCVMKYEAKQVGITTTPISQASGLPWVSISQTDTIAYSQNVAGCSGCHLITEAEWMTLAQNVLSVSTNWSGGAVGSGYIPRGNSDSAAATDGTIDLTGVNKRTLTLTNGEIIWDLAGNVFEWTTGVTNGSTAQQPGILGNGGNWREWTSITANGTLPINPSPAGTGLPGANTWSGSKGIGQIYSNSDDAGLYGFLRSGSWYRGSIAGVLALYLPYSPSGTNNSFGFRVSR